MEWKGPDFRRLVEPACADGQLLVMVHGLSQELSENPAIYTGDDHTLWIYFPHSCFVCDGLMEDYGIPGALILREFPFSFRGNTEALEPGEIICSLEKDRLRMELKNVSGREFQELCDLCLWVKLDSSEHCRELEDMLRQMDWRNRVCRSHADAICGAGHGPASPATRGYPFPVPPSFPGGSSGGLRFQSIGRAAEGALDGVLPGWHQPGGVHLYGGYSGGGNAFSHVLLGAILAPGPP